MILKLLFLLSLFSVCQFQILEGSGEENQIDEYWLQHLIERIQIPQYLSKRAYELAKNSKLFADEEEILALDASVPDYAKQIYTNQILNAVMNDEAALPNATDKLISVTYFAFRAFGCDQDNIWPSVYNLTRDNLDCIAFTLLQKAYEKSEFTRKYFARAIHYGMTSKAPIDHRIHEMMVYQYLLPTSDRVWFNNVKIQLQNTFWNEQELSKESTYDENSFSCGSIPFIDAVQEQINYYYYL